ncbi:MAG: glycosyltransferase [Cyclonatronaceae bacterium]
MPHVLMLAASRSLHTCRWACDLATAGYHITLLTADADEPASFLKAYHEAGVALERLPYHSKSGFIRAAGFVYRRVMASEAEGRPVRFIHAFYTTDYGLLSVLSGAAPVLLSVMGTDVFSYPGRSRLHRFGTAWILKRAACVAATSRIMARRVEAPTAGTVRPFHTPFGVDTDLFRPVEKSLKTRSEQALRIISVRHLHHKYGLDVLVEAVRKLTSAYPKLSVKLDIGGDGPEEKALHAQIKQSGLTKNLRLLGQIPAEKLPGLLSQYDVFVAPSREESFGVAILEASACGLPVIGTEAGGIPEVIIHEKTGLIVPPEDSEALKNALYRLAEHPEDRQEMGEKGVQFVRNTYSRSIALARMRQVYAQMLDSKKRPPVAKVR